MGADGPDFGAIGRRLLGVALLLPLVAVFVWGLQVNADCELDCGEAGRGVFPYLLLATPPAAAGVLALVWDLRRLPRAGRLMGGLAFAGVLLCTLILTIAAFSALSEAIDLLTGEAQVHYLDDPDGSVALAQDRRNGRILLVVSSILIALAIGAAMMLVAAGKRWQHTRS